MAFFMLYPLEMWHIFRENALTWPFPLEKLPLAKIVFLKKNCDFLKKNAFFFRKNGLITYKK